MTNLFKKLAWFIWPPLEAMNARRYVKKLIAERNSEYQKLDSEVREMLSKFKDLIEVEKLSKYIYESEIKRKEVIENKAITFATVTSLAISISALVPGLFTSEWNLPTTISVTSSLLFIIAISYLLVAVYYSILSRRIQGFAMISTDGILTKLKNTKKNSKNISIENIVSYLSYTKYNEPYLTLKSNAVVVAERLFVRGLVMLGIALCLSAGSKVYLQSMAAINNKNTMVYVCEVPNIVGQESKAADSLIHGLGLQPIHKLQFSTTIRKNVVLSQDPIGGYILDPCQGSISITISAGENPSP